MLTVEQIARVCHEANAALCEVTGDIKTLPWDDPHTQASAINGVRYILDNPTATPADSHDNWSKEKLAAGWQYGPDKDPVLKTHPCLVPYYQLPLQQRLKDYLFSGIVRALAKSAQDEL